MKNIFAIVPRLPPAICGVGDYAFNLACQLRKDFGIETHFLVCDPQWKGPERVDGFAVKLLPRHSATSLQGNLPADAPVLLHYVNYGFERRGCPLWLVDGLSRWKKSNPESRLVTMFHELYAFGPIWSSSFWLSPIQRKLAADLSRISDNVITSMKKYADQLNEWRNISSHLNAISMPVYSTVGEIDYNILPLNRLSKAVVFGSMHNRENIFKNKIQLNHVINKLGITEIIDIGPGEINIDVATGIAVTVKGVLGKAELQEILTNARYGLLNYNTAYLAKSTIFAGYCANGVVSINFYEYNDGSSDGLCKNVHFLSKNDLNADFHDEIFTKISINAYEWYSGHNLGIHSEIYRKLIAVGK